MITLEILTLSLKLWLKKSDYYYLRFNFIVFKMSVYHPDHFSNIEFGM